jgi:hypothetical protein
VIEQNPGDRKILDGPCRMDAIIGRIRYFHFTERIFFDAEGGHDLKLSGLKSLSIGLAKKLSKVDNSPGLKGFLCDN